MHDPFCSLFTTPFGAGVVYSSDSGITRVEFPDMAKITATENNIAANAGNSSSLTIYASILLQKYFAGERIEFCDIPVDIPALPPFRHKVLTAVRHIPYGTVRSYAQIAFECASPEAARAVGGAMASNNLPIIIPCHRIVGADGRLTGFSAPGGENMKLMLLMMEGIEFEGKLVTKNQLVMNR